ncbi:hypothetical protein RSOLAG22IIIB_09428 [Rhizoctonia solani]|uniref:Uncharacterized protein n=1 Tax=Rhizoctonia solani TaxID=456999 RepID=A0A0K6FYM9_9AGAM|nr:hypothetical protein RSOLAG22IIIB_09428 [Rhizoctonia solani]
MADFDEAQAQSQLDELTNHVERAFIEYTGSLDSEPEELDEASIDEVLDRVEKSYGSPGNSATTSSDLASNLGAALLHVQGKTFTVTQVGTVRNIPGKAKVFGQLNGKQAYVIKSLPLKFFTIITTDTKGRCVYISTKRQEVKSGGGFGTWN